MASGTGEREAAVSSGRSRLLPRPLAVTGRLLVTVSLTFLGLMRATGLDDFFDDRTRHLDSLAARRRTKASAHPSGTSS